MAENKKSFILYCDQKGLWDKLSDEQAGKLIKHIIAYVNDENPKAPDFVTELAFEPIKAQLKRDLKRWEKIQNARSEAGKAGAEARWQNKANNGKRIDSMAKMAVNGNVNVNGNVIDIGDTSLQKFIIVNSQYATEPKYRLYGVNGIVEFIEVVNASQWIRTEEMAAKFLRDKAGQMFNDYDHIIKSYNKYVEKQFA